MAIYDCFQYFNEDHLVDLRLNILDKYVDYFVISESTKTHQGKSKNLNFNLNNFPKFKDKIKLLIADYDKNITFNKHTGGESPIEQHQRNFLINGIKDASPEDLIILSDTDEIPDMTKIDQIKENKRYIAFCQKMFMYKLNLQNLNESNWIGSKITKKIYFFYAKFEEFEIQKLSFLEIRQEKSSVIEGGWHFSFLKTPDQILEKIKSFSHGEFNDEKLSKDEIEKIIENRDIFNRGFDLKKVKIDESFPSYILKIKTNC